MRTYAQRLLLQAPVTELLEGVSSKTLHGAEGHNAEAPTFGGCRAGPTKHVSCGYRSC